jgi:hypothetical protein
MGSTCGCVFSCYSICPWCLASFEMAVPTAKLHPVPAALRKTNCTARSKLMCQNVWEVARRKSHLPFHWRGQESYLEACFLSGSNFCNSFPCVISNSRHAALTMSWFVRKPNSLIVVWSLFCFSTLVHSFVVLLSVFCEIPENSVKRRLMRLEAFWVKSLPFINSFHYLQMVIIE